MKRVYSYNPKAHVGPAVSKNGNKQATSSRHDPDMLFRRFTALLYHFKTLQKWKHRINSETELHTFPNKTEPFWLLKTLTKTVKIKSSQLDSKVTKMQTRT